MRAAHASSREATLADLGHDSSGVRPYFSLRSTGPEGWRAPMRPSSSPMQPDAIAGQRVYCAGLTPTRPQEKSPGPRRKTLSTRAYLERNTGFEPATFGVVEVPVDQRGLTSVTPIVAIMPLSSCSRMWQWNTNRPSFGPSNLIMTNTRAPGGKG